MKFPTTALAILIFVVISLSLASAAHYMQIPSTNVQDYDDSMYLDSNAAPRADVFYTPFNAYRTYCAAMFCPASTKMIQPCRLSQIRVKESKAIMINSAGYASSNFHTSIPAKQFAPVYRYVY